MVGAGLGIIPCGRVNALVMAVKYMTGAVGVCVFGRVLLFLLLWVVLARRGENDPQKV
jgi:hypothetical protein